MVHQAQRFVGNNFINHISSSFSARKFQKKTICVEIPLKSPAAFWDNFEEIKVYILEYNLTPPSRSYSPDDITDEDEC